LFRRTSPSPDTAKLLRLASLAISIPAFLATGPLVGLFLGKWIGGYWGHAQAGIIIGLVIGFAAGVRETVIVIRRIQEGTQ
jgi:ATP synthase protein I